jgi:hypothetical protein
MASDTYFVLLILTDGEIHDMQVLIIRYSAYY